jgi:hypothetical protein
VFLGQIARTLDLFERSCAITVALKITDDSCKMDEASRAIFMTLYDQLPSKKNRIFDESVFEVIAIGREHPSAFIYARIKHLREKGMDEIGRPRMKAFKADIREKLRQLQV